MQDCVHKVVGLHIVCLYRIVVYNDKYGDCIEKKKKKTKGMVKFIAGDALFFGLSENSDCVLLF